MKYQHFHEQVPENSSCLKKIKDNILTPIPEKAGVGGLNQMSAGSDLFPFFSIHFLHIRFIPEFHVVERWWPRSPNLFSSKSHPAGMDLGESYIECHWL